MSQPPANRFLNGQQRNPRSLRPGPQARWGLAHSAAAYIVAILVSVAAVAVVTSAGAQPDSTASKVAGAAGLWAGFVGGPLFATRARGAASLSADFGARIHSRDLLAAALAGVATQLLVVPAVSWPLVQLTDRDINASARALLGPPGPTRWLIVAVVVVGAPLAEELFFRGLLLRSLARHLTDRWAVIVGSALFAATHFNALALPGLFAAGLVFAILVLKTGRLGPAVVAHATFNATTIIALWR